MTTARPRPLSAAIPWSAITRQSNRSNFSGAAVAGFSQLSAQNFSAQSAILSGALSASTGNFSGQLASGLLTVSGSDAISGTLTAGTSTLASLAVSGPAIFTGSTTIAGLTVTRFNPGLLQGSGTEGGRLPAAGGPSAVEQVPSII
ncbi:MAG: hypothetical protein M3Z14_06455 [Candidatus Eremiobacteraeota bacterium]|nr:hypothetical protein [Candidatus Eremiobacteraeota bacterium]